MMPNYLNPPPPPEHRPRPAINCAGCGATHDQYACPYCGRLHSNVNNIAHTSSLNKKYDECLPEIDYYSNPKL